MKVLYFFQYFNTPDAPGGTRTFEMARRLVRAGHEVTLVTSDYSGRFGSTKTVVDRVDGIEVHYLAVPYANTMAFRSRYLAFVRFAAGATLVGLRHRPDIVFASSTPLTIAIPGLIAAWRWSVPFVFEIRDLWPHVPIAMGALRNPMAIALARFLERLAYRRASDVIALSPGMARGVAETGYPRDRIHVIPNAADLELFGQLDADPTFLHRMLPQVGEGPVILYAGALGRANRVDYLVEVAAAMQGLRSDAKFVIVGEGSERDRVRALAADLGVLDSNLFLADRMPKRMMPALFAAATVVTSVFDVNQALEDNSANKFFDALAAGRPIAINYGGWQAELIRESGAGKVLSTDPVEAASQLAAWLGDAHGLLRAGANARTLAESRFARDDLFTMFRGVLEGAAPKS
jgi:glycosyltransferase involved in cell wall biosynthesis